MATSSAMSTNNQYVEYKITVTQNSQNITNNTSNVTVSVEFYRTNTGYSTYGTGTVYCKINGTTYSAAVGPDDKITSSGIILFSKKLDITHNSDGSKTLACSAWISHNAITSSEQNYNQALTAIPRKSTLSVSNGTLGITQTLTVTKQASGFTSTITAVCGSAYTTVCTKSASTSVPFTPPIAWASQNKTGTSVSVKYTITAYNGNTSLGSNTHTTTCAIPSSVKPSCVVTVADNNGYYATYGAYIKGKSKINVTVAPTLSYDSPIASYSTTANGSTYTASSFTTGVLKTAGNCVINSTVTDKRGRTSVANSKTRAVLDYSEPTISKLSVGRCEQNGNENDKGEYIKATFSCAVTSLITSDKANTSIYSLLYKKSVDQEFTSIDISDLNLDDTYSITDQNVIFAADSGSSYDVKLIIEDDFNTGNNAISKIVPVSTGVAILHFKADGTGVGIGKVSEISGALDIGFKTRLNGGLIYPILAAGTDLNDVRIPNKYILANQNSSDYSNTPFTDGTATLTVESCGDADQVRQEIIYCHKTMSTKYERFYYSQSWGNWVLMPIIQSGFISITPSASNTPTSVHITFARSFNVAPDVVATPRTGAPGTAVLGVGATNVTITGFDLYLTRTDTATTGVHWIAVQK